MKVLQLFHRYLDNSSNWAYRLIKDLPPNQISIAAAVFMNKQFLLPNASYFTPLINLQPSEHENIFKRAIRKLNIYVLKSKLKKHANDFDIMHAHFAHTGCEFMDIAGLLHKKLVVSFYGYDYENLPFLSPQYLPQYQLLFKQAAAIITEGAFGKQTLINMGCEANKIHIVPLGVDISQIPVTKNYKKKNELKLVQIANFKEKKGHIYTIKALDIAIKTHPNISLTLVGNGQLLPEIKNLVNDLKLNNHVQFIDQISFSNLHEFIIDYDVLIQPSIRTEDHDTEGGAPVIILDAQACGLPIISTYHADIPNITLEHKTALLSNEEDYINLADNIIQFYEMDESNYTLFSENAKDYILKHFDSKYCSAQLQKVYNNL